MKSVLCLLVVAGAMVPVVASAQGASWRGPGCTVGAATFVVCSTEPGVPDDPSPCYVSHFPNYTPDAIQMDLIGVCQAAKVALAHLDGGLAGAVADLNARMFNLAADVSTYRQEAAWHAGSVKAVAIDMQKVGAWVIAYSQTRSAHDRRHIENALADVTDDAEVWGG